MRRPPARRLGGGPVPGLGDAVEASVEGLPAAISLAPGSVVPALGGEIVLAPTEPSTAGGARDVTSDTVREGLLQAGPLAVAGLVANGASAVVTILLARLLTTRGYGSLAQLTGLFLVVSMPGSALIVGVVRRVAAWQGAVSADRVRRWAARLYVRGMAAVAALAVVVVVARDWIDARLSSPDAFGVVAMLVAGAVWVLLSLDRGLLQAHRAYRSLAVNLLVEGGVRVAAMLCLVGAGGGVAGAAGGVLLAEVVTAVHARLAADRAWAAESDTGPGPGAASVAGGPTGAHTPASVADGPGSVGGAGADRPPLPAGSRRAAALDLATALPAMAMIALLQNVDVIVLARDAPHGSGAYAAISVASKAMIFGALVLGGYLLPEAAIRWHEGGHALRQLLVTLVLLAVPAGLLLAAAVGAPSTLLSLVFSARYTGASHAFAPLVLAMVFLSITVTLTMYLLAIGSRWIGGVLLAGSVAAVAAVAVAHGAPVATARNDLLVQAGLAVAVTAGFALAHRERLSRR